MEKCKIYAVAKAGKKTLYKDIDAAVDNFDPANDEMSILMIDDPIDALIDLMNVGAFSAEVVEIEVPDKN